MFLTLCAATVVIVGVIFWAKMHQSPETVEELLYRIDHPAGS